MEQSKACSLCKAILPFTNFHKHPVGKFGLNPRCKSCKALGDKKSSAKNPNKNILHSIEYRKNNPEYMSTWRKINKDKMLANNANYRQKKKSNEIFYVSNKEISKLYKSNCFYCGSSLNIEADHIIPIDRGGRHSIANLVPACALCNRSKSNSTITEWKKRKSSI